MTVDSLELKKACLIRICDDDIDLANALQLYLELEGWKTAIFHDAKSFLTGDRPSIPGCLILDVKMPGLSGLECQRVMKEHEIELPIIFITGHGDIDMAVQAVLDGACDFLQKPVDENRLLKSIIKASSQSLAKLTGAVSKESAQKRLSQLTVRETEIVKLIASGLVSREIAERLGIALRTVEVHRASALKKLETHDPAIIKHILKMAET